MGLIHLEIDDADGLLGLVAGGIDPGEASKCIVDEADVGRHWWGRAFMAVNLGGEDTIL